MATKTKDKDLFAEEEVKKEEVKEEEIIDQDEEMPEHDDLKEGFMAESDPASKMNDPLAQHKGPADDVVGKSLDGQLTALGRKTAEKLNKLPKHKVLIPFKDLNPDDDFVVVGTNGWNTQIKRGVAVMLPDEIIQRLSASGESPTIVR